MFKVSVVVPVFNVARFLEQAVYSALAQPEVGEVILVEDGSKDNSLIVCQKLNSEFEKVRLLTHTNGENLGVCESRNLGIRSAEFDYIAFLDADDWYLPNRFKKEKELFKNPEVMAVYSLSSIKYPNGKEVMFGYDSNLLLRWGTESPKEVYCQIMRNNIILGHTNANTFRKKVFEISGFFDSRLKLHEDTELWNRIAKNFLFHAGELYRPVSVARRHDNNTISHRSRQSQLYFLWVFLDNIGIENLLKCEKEYFVNLYSRAISNPIRLNLIRKVVFHISLKSMSVFSNFFISNFYYSKLERKSKW